MPRALVPEVLVAGLVRQHVLLTWHADEGERRRDHLRLLSVEDEHALSNRHPDLSVGADGGVEGGGVRQLGRDLPAEAANAMTGQVE